MPSSGYTAWSVVADEQPTTAKWNIIGSNMASFNNGNGFEDSIIIARHIAAGAVTAAKLGSDVSKLIQRIDLAAPAANFNFTAIPAGFKDLEIRVKARVSNTGSHIFAMQINTDTGGNYDSQRLEASAGVSNAGELLANTYLRVGVAPGSTVAANVFDYMDIRILNYADTDNHKGVISQSARKDGVTTGTIFTEMDAGFWRSAAAITSVQLYANGGGNLVAGSSASLYGRI